MAKTALNNKILESGGLWLLITLFVIGTAVYIFPVGRIQPGHYLAPIIVLIGAFFIRWRDLRVCDKWLLAFGAYVLLVNAFYFIKIKHPEFMSSIIYWAYNIALFIALSHIIKASIKVKSTLGYVLVLCILIILSLWAFGYLRTDIQNMRFIAQFNDPNQMGHWLLCAFVGICLLSSRGVLSNRYIQLGLLLIIALLISAAGSRSATIGLVPLAIGFIWLRFFREKTDFSKPVLYVILIVFISSLIVVFSTSVNKHALPPEQKSSLTQEIPANRILSTEWVVEAKLRGYFRPIEYPQNLLFGAGHGDEARFNSPYEIHASLLGVFFYYGIVGFFLFLGFLYQVFRRLNWPEAVMLSAPFVYGFFTYGLRTPIFWVLMAIVVALRPLPNET